MRGLFIVAPFIRQTEPEISLPALYSITLKKTEWTNLFKQKKETRKKIQFLEEESVKYLGAQGEAKGRREVDWSI